LRTEGICRTKANLAANEDGSTRKIQKMFHMPVPFLAAGVVKLGVCRAERRKKTERNAARQEKERGIKVIRKRR